MTGSTYRLSCLLMLDKWLPVLQSECELLAEIFRGLEPVLIEMSSPQARFSSITRERFAGLMPALQRAEKVLEKIKHASTSKFRRLLQKRQLAQELRSSTVECLSWINKLPLASFEREEEIRELKSKLERLGKSLNDADPSRDEDEEDHFLAEVMSTLRLPNSEEAGTTSSEGGKALDRLLQLLARRFDSDVATVLSEWQEVKEEARRLQEMVEYTAENKRLMERDLMQVLLYLDKGTEQEQATRSEAEGPSSTENAAGSSTSDVSPPDDFVCVFCSSLMEDPVLCASGYSYCRECLMKWLNDGKEICPYTGSRISPEVYPNRALRNLIRRWKEGTTTLRQLNLQDVEGSVGPPTRLTIDVPPEPVDEAVNSARSFSQNELGSRSFSSVPPTTPSVGPHITFLKSPSSDLRKVKSNLKELASVALHPRGQWEIHCAGGVVVIAKYLSSEDPYIAEKAADVFDNLTFQPKMGNNYLRYDQREEILSSVTECALDPLIDQMSKGNSGTRFAAARALVNLLEDDQARERVRHKQGVVQGLLGLENICTRALFESSQEGIDLCRKGLAFLAGDKPPVSASVNTNRDLSTALLRLVVSSAANRKLVEETLGVLSYMVRRVGRRDSGTLLDKDGIKVLIGLLHPPEALASRGQPFSRPNSLTEEGKRELLNIFDEISKAEAFMVLLVECELITHLLGRITDVEAGKDFVNQGSKLLWKCIQGSEQKYSPVHFHCDLQLEMKGVVDILRRDGIPSEAKLDLLSALVYLCEWQNGYTLKESFIKTSESFLNTGGVAALVVLGKSPLGPLREKTAVMFRQLSESCPCHKVLQTSEAAMLISNLLADESDKCRCEAVIALASLGNSGGWERQLEVMPVEQFVDTLLSTSSSDCRKASMSVLRKICSPKKHSAPLGNPELPVVLREKTTIKGLLDIVRFPASDDEAVEATELLMSLVEQDHSICSFLVEENEDGLSVLIKTGVQPGNRPRLKVVKLLQAFAEVSDGTRGALMDVGGVPLLVNAVEEGSNTGRHCDVAVASNALEALKSMVKYKPAMEAVIEADFAEKAIECLTVRTLSPGLLDLLSLILDRDATAERRKATAERIRQARGVQALVGVLSVHSAGLKEKQLVAKILTRLIQLDDEVQPILREKNGIKLLNDLLVRQAAEAEANRSSNSSRGTEVLETLIAATEDLHNLELLLNERCIEPLLSLMSLARNSLLTELEGLALDLLLKLSRAALTPRSGADFMVSRVSEQVLRVIGAASDDSLVERAARIIRNISLFGPHERAIMNAGDEGAVKILLRKISLCQAEVPTDDVNFSVIALERFMLEDEGRRSLLQEDGILYLIKFLSKSRGQAKLFATRILVMLASEHNPSKDWFSEMWKLKGDLLLSMRESLESRDKDTKIQAAELLRCLILKGSGAEVCSSISDTGCHSKLRDLQTNPECAQSANAALEAYNKTRKDNRQGPLRFLLSRAS
ncbi:hypothetical protein R1sor_018016 [Riccia sorocarpa]|uniref:RING-type E3 ubiquitin transferase n=1 Tax=Riccia sorocarpa TaxID=122646 RepID=A0ABD3IEQ6_9MARC